MSIRLYRPANGTEGYAFIDEWCSNCERDKAFWNGDWSAGCRIVADTFVYFVSDPKYPREWTYDVGGKPCCTAFIEIGKPVAPEPDTQSLDLFE